MTSMVSKRLLCNHCGRNGTPSEMTCVCKVCRKGWVHDSCADAYMAQVGEWLIRSNCPRCERARLRIGAEP